MTVSKRFFLNSQPISDLKIKSETDFFRSEPECLLGTSIQICNSPTPLQLVL